MGFLKLAAGVAVGYVLGSRAGREKYENIAATARKVGSHPTVVQAQEKAKALVGTQTEKVNAKLSAAAASADPNTGSSTKASTPASSTTSLPTSGTTGSKATGSPATGSSTTTATTTAPTAAVKRSATKPAEFGVATEPPR